MQERARPARERTDTGPSGLGDLFGGPVGSGGPVTVVNGPYAESLPAGGMTVAQIRGRYRDRFDIDPRSLAILDGDVVDDDTIVQAGQLLRFSRRAGEKGLPPRARVAEEIQIAGDRIRVTSPEGERRTIRLDRALQILQPPAMDTAGIVPPDGFKGAFSRGPVTIWIHQTPPAVHNFKWIAEGSPAPFGPRALYREVRIALPYVLVFAVFARSPNGGLHLTTANECFFRNEPLRSTADPVLYPALLNCSRFRDPEGRPLSWICTQYLDMGSIAVITDENQRVRTGLERLLHCLFDTGFNYSSERHEGSSWFAESREVDPRISTVEAWEEATRADPGFATRVAWLPVGLDVAGICNRIFRMRGEGS